MVRLIILILLLAVESTGLAAVCDGDEFTTRVSGKSQCLMMRKFGASDPAVLLVWLHGDVSSGGPANYHFPISEKAAKEFDGAKVLSVALVRPGYADGDGNTSGSEKPLTERYDHYTQQNVTEVASAIAHLREQFKPQRVIVIGHSGGAATTAIILGMQPGLIDAGVLVACPCDLVTWRVGRRAWTRSEDPIKWVEQIAPTARVIALTGERDDNTGPDLARQYVEALKARQINATFKPLPGETHNSAFRSPEVFAVIRELF